jgi:poly-gamma-glutamate synthesis protein (capsule biosynthesis protein)
MKLILVGDTNIQNRERPVEAFSRVRHLWEGCDLLFGHAEGMFTREAAAADDWPLPYKREWRHSTPEMVSAFTEAGFSGVSFASNVCAERSAVRQTIETCNAAGLPFCGIGLNRDEARRPLVLNAGDEKVAFLSRTCVFHPHIIPATGVLPGAATVKAHTAYVPGRRALEMPGAPPDIHTYADDQELAMLVEDIAHARSVADFVVLSMHWGVSRSETVIEYQREIAHAAIDAGTDVIMGHHPHLIQEVELYCGKPIFYSLGNFAFDWVEMRTRGLEGLVVEVQTDAERRRFTIVPVQRNDSNLVSALDPTTEAWQSIATFLGEHANPELRRALRTDDGAIRFTVD